LRYVLNERYRLRGWYKLPTGVLDTQLKMANFLSLNEYRLLLKCDGAHRMEEENLSEQEVKFLEKLEKSGVIRKAILGEFLQPEQAYVTYPARYRREAHWSITGACNLKCRHCFMSAPSAKHGSPSHEQIIAIADQLAECGVFRVGLTGGEPLIRDDFLDIIDAMNEREIGISVIFTNGWLVDEKLLDELDKRNAHTAFQLSYDGVGQHDFLRGVDGAEEKTLKALKLLQERDHKVSVSMSLHKGNRHTVRESVNLMASLGVKSMKVGTMMTLGEWMQPEVRDLQMTPADEQAVFEEYIPQYFEDNAPVSIMLSGSFMYNPGDPKWGIFYERKISEKAEKKTPSCGVLTHNFYIGADGMVAPCMGMGDCGFAKNFPNLFETPLKDILRDSELIRLSGVTVGEVRDRSGKCRDCEFIDRCFGGCRNAALMAGDDYYGVDPSICEFFKNGWDKRIREVADPAFEEYIKRCPPKGKGKPKEESAEECP